MLQKDVNKLLNRSIKEIAKQTKWKSSGGFLFRKERNLVFTALFTVNNKDRKMFYSLGYKYYDLDSVFWKIMKMESNEKLSLSLRVTGAFTVPMKDISEKTVLVSEGNPENLKNAIIRILNNDEKKIVRLADKIKNIEENNRFLDEWLFKHKKKYPESAIDIHLEKVLGFILLNDYKTAYKIIRERTLKTVKHKQLLP